MRHSNPDYENTEDYSGIAGVHLQHEKIVVYQLLNRIPEAMSVSD
jgi:hypothetical protein